MRNAFSAQKNIFSVLWQNAGIYARKVLFFFLRIGGHVVVAYALFTRRAVPFVRSKRRGAQLEVEDLVDLERVLAR